MGVFLFSKVIYPKKIVLLYEVMQLIENIKNYFGKAKLNSLLNKNVNRKVSFCNLNNAKNVGILIELKEESDYKNLLNFIKVLKGDYGIRNVSSIAFYDDKEEPFYLQSKLSFDFFLSSDLNWKREVQKSVCETFRKEEFDLLIDLTDGFVLPLRNLLLTSQAQFKVGRFSDENAMYYDFMIDAGKSNFSQFTQELVRYLTMINEK